MKSVTENIFLKTRSTSFCGTQSISLSTLSSPRGVLIGHQLQQHRVQFPQRQMADALLVQSLADALGKCQFVVDTFKISVCLLTKSFQSCPTLCDPMDCNPPGSSVYGILQVRILEWVAMPSSRGSFQPRDRTHISDISCIGRWVLYYSHHLGSPLKMAPPTSCRPAQDICG